MSKLSTQKNSSEALLGAGAVEAVAPFEDNLRERITVALVIHSMKVGGAERSIARLVNTLDPDSFHPIVVCLTESGPAVNWITKKDVPIVEVGKKPGRDKTAVPRMAEVFRHHGVDLVHSHNWGTLIECSKAVRLAGVTGHVHAERGTVLGELEMRGVRMYLRGAAAGWAMRGCDRILTNSRSVARRIAERCYFPEERVLVIPNGIEPIRIADERSVDGIRNKLGISPKALVLGSVGRLVSVKGFDLAIEALAKIVESDSEKDVHLVLVGDGPEEQSLRRVAAAHDIGDRVHFPGRSDEVSSWLGLFDLFLNTSHSEGMSQSLAEAMSVGLPIVATDVGDTEVLIGGDNQCGRLVGSRDPNEFAAAIKDIAEDELLEACGIASRRRQQELFGIETMGRRYESLYRQILQR